MLSEKKQSPKVYILHDFIYIIFLKGQIIEKNRLAVRGVKKQVGTYIETDSPHTHTPTHTPLILIHPEHPKWVFSFYCKRTRRKVYMKLYMHNVCAFDSFIFILFSLSSHNKQLTSLFRSTF